jgi:hypothetical protein
VPGLRTGLAADDPAREGRIGRFLEVDAQSVPWLPGHQRVLHVQLDRLRAAPVNVVVYVSDLMGDVGPVCSWEDHQSRTRLEAAERAWEISNSHVGNLSGWMLEARMALESVLRGVTIGPEDWVEVDGVSFVCRPDGFEESEVDWDEGLDNDTPFG